MHRPARGRRGASRDLGRLCGRSRRATDLPRDFRAVRPVRALAHCARDRQGRACGDHAGTVADLLRRAVRRDAGGRDRRAAVHAVRPRRCTASHRGLRAAPAAHQCGEGARDGRCARRAVGDRRRRTHARVGGIPGDIRTAHCRGRPGDLPVHVRHHARAARGSAAHPPRDRYAHGCGTVRHRDPAWRSVFLPIIACLGARLVARHPGAACARRTDRHVLWEIRR